MLIAIWLAFRVLVVKDNLEAARAVLSSAQQGGDMGDALTTIGEHAAVATAAANDPVWRAAEIIPGAGENLRAVRFTSDALDALVNGIAGPVVQMQGDGEGNLLARSLPVLQSGAHTLAPLTADLEGIRDSPALVDQVRSAVEMVADVLTAAQPVLDVLPDALGADGAKNYLLVFQNNAESLPLGGSAASQTLIGADAGELEIVAQAGSGDFPYAPLDLEIPDSATSLFGSTYGERVNMSTTRPDWPSAAQMLRAFWNRDIDETRIDGVISVDPLALARILRATGPIDVDGVMIDDSNAVNVLLSEVYAWWDAYTPEGAVASDAFFASVASQMFAKVASGDFGIMDMASAVSESVDRGSILVWLEDADAQSVVGAGRISGVLPADNMATTTLGVYFRDVSASKIDYYMNSAIEAELTCVDGRATLTATAALRLDITQEAADALPRYVQSFRNGSDYFSTHIFMYAPPGMEIESVRTDGAWVEPFRQGNVDLGREVAPFQMRIVPGDKVTVEATFVGPDDIGPLDVWFTPMIRETAVRIDDSCAAGADGL
ncbi:DUF4012 domain-containing protein [Microbacterium sp.]|uniref:DUF4012 domain-containing protein n=1 Tax=Microbacterium sp. TaxID=51671 RepID=UPI003A89F00E